MGAVLCQAAVVWAQWGLYPRPGKAPAATGHRGGRQHPGQSGAKLRCSDVPDTGWGSPEFSSEAAVPHSCCMDEGSQQWVRACHRDTRAVGCLAWPRFPRHPPPSSAHQSHNPVPRGSPCNMGPGRGKTQGSTGYPTREVEWEDQPESVCLLGQPPKSSPTS